MQHFLFDNLTHNVHHFHNCFNFQKLTIEELPFIFFFFIHSNNSLNVKIVLTNKRIQEREEKREIKISCKIRAGRDPGQTLSFQVSRRKCSGIIYRY